MLNSDYHVLLNRDYVPPSWVIAQLPGACDCPDVTSIFKILEGAELGLEPPCLASNRTIPDSRWEIELTHVDHRGTQEFRLWVIPSEKLESFHFDLAHLQEGEIAAARESRWSLGLSTVFGVDPLADFHQQLILLAALAPAALLFFDVTACRAHNRSWVLETAASRVPPSPQTLFSIHAVLPEGGRNRGLWLHTHGLIRCGITELEICNLPTTAASSFSRLLNTVATMFMETGMPGPQQPFSPGAGFELIWIPWQLGLRKVRRGSLGAQQDRNAFHSSPSAMLFAHHHGWFGPRIKDFKVYLPLLEGNPLLYISSAETERMAALAQERFSAFSELFDRQRAAEDWVFLVKLGYPVEHPDQEEQREHLWFRLHGIEGEVCDGTLVNQPHGIPSMQEGERGQHDLSRMSDWEILCPLGHFGPDSVIHLQRAMEQQAP